jgi:nitrogen fixation/metabolism regulation signal transduction histidine kinase
MGFNRFYLNVAARVFLILVFSLLFTFMLNNPRRIFSAIFSGLMIIYLTLDLLHYVNKTNRALTKFLDHLKEEDTSITFPKNVERTFGDLYGQFNKITKDLRDTKIETSNRKIYLQNIVEHVGTGIIAYDHMGRFDLLNKAARELLAIPRLNTLKELEKLNPRFVSLVKMLKPGEEKLFKHNRQGELLLLSIRAAKFTMLERKIKLISLQDITHELEENELENWQKLIRVLTHEIMNSITPITTLTTSVKRGLRKNNRMKTPGEILHEDIEDIVVSNELIEERANGLTNFVRKYRSLTILPRVNTTEFSLHDLFAKLHKMLKMELQQLQVEFDCRVNPADLKIVADRQLVEQMLINLIKNAMEATLGTSNATINLTAHQREERMYISIEDNGPGIPPEITDKIFMPFFTTKKKGSGIGLSLSRQIMRLHKGSISIQSKPGEKTAVLLKF